MRRSFSVMVLSLLVTAAYPRSTQLDREQTADEQIVHALNRVAFGARPGDVERIRTMGVDRWIAQQLYPEHVVDRSMERVLSSFPSLALDQNTLLAQYSEMVASRQARKNAQDTVATGRDSAMARQMIARAVEVVLDVQGARVARAVGSERQLLEVMVDFWENHFSVYARKGGAGPYYLVDYDERVIRSNAMGKFRHLLGAVAKSPVMLWYLDNARSRADSSQPTLLSVQQERRGDVPARATRKQEANQNPANKRRVGLNENYGRELLELHTLGVDGGYTQKDVINVARALTGWTIRPPEQGGGFIFRPVMHDAGEKIVLGHRLAAGRGIEDGEDVLDIVARHQSTARFIATKLVRRFVSDEPPESLVERAAATFQKTDGDIREVLRTILTSPEFFSRAAFRSKVKSPFEVVVSAARVLGAEPDTTSRTALAIAYLGQPIFGHQAPDGWPEVSSEWMNTGAILNRINFGLAVAADRLPGVTIAHWPEASRLRTAPRLQQVDGVITALLGGAASSDTRRILMSGENPLLTGSSTAPMDTNHTSADDMDDAATRKRTRVTRNGAMNGRGFGSIPRLEGLAQVVGLALGAPEFQRR
jgi:uncharacterized protein (DUF1800 family)